MAGTIFGLPLSQRVDSNGNPSVGWLLYLYNANSSTPVNSYQDTALTVLNTWPIQADASGMMGVFWLADGSYRARGTNADGSIVYFDMANVLAIGASTGSAPPPGVDPTTIFQTGDLIWLDSTGTRTGWVIDNGTTIGSALSGASQRANADCQALFQLLWNTKSDPICPVIGGRGASALADWGANKKLTLPDKRGYVPGGLDTMGTTAAGRYSGVPIILGDATIAGGLLGEETHLLSTGEMPSHNHTATVTDPGHPHNARTATNVIQASGTAFAGSGLGGSSAIVNVTVDPATTGISVAIAGTGGGGLHNNVQRTVLGTFYRKL